MIAFEILSIFFFLAILVLSMIIFFEIHRKPNMLITHYDFAFSLLITAGTIAGFALLPFWFVNNGNLFCEVIDALACFVTFFFASLSIIYATTKRVNRQIVPQSILAGQQEDATPEDTATDIEQAEHFLKKEQKKLLKQKRLEYLMAVEAKKNEVKSLDNQIKDLENKINSHPEAHADIENIEKKYKNLKDDDIINLYGYLMFKHHTIVPQKNKNEFEKKQNNLLLRFQNREHKLLVEQKRKEMELLELQKLALLKRYAMGPDRDKTINYFLDTTTRVAKIDNGHPEIAENANDHLPFTTNLTNAQTKQIDDELNALKSKPPFKKTVEQNETKPVVEKSNE